MPALLDAHKSTIVKLCQDFGVTRLEVFGSVVTDAFDPLRSDIDFLVSYPEGYDFGPWLGRFQELEEALAEALAHPVNLVMTSALRNPGFAHEASKTRQVIFDAAHLTHAA